MMTVKSIENIQVEKRPNEDYSDYKEREMTLISVGLNIIKVVKEMDECLAPMISNTYFTCMLTATCELYVVSSVLFNRDKFEIVLLSISGLSVTWLAMFRVYRLTTRGHRLAKFMKEYPTIWIDLSSRLKRI